MSTPSIKLIKHYENNARSFEENNAITYNSIVYIFSKAILESNDVYNTIANLIATSALSNHGLTIIISINDIWEQMMLKNTKVFKSVKEYIESNTKTPVIRVIYDKPVDTKHQAFHTAFAWYVNDSCKKIEILNTIENTELKAMTSPINLENTLICEMNEYKIATKCSSCKKFCNVIDVDQIYINNRIPGGSKFIPTSPIMIDSMRKCTLNPETLLIISKPAEYLYKYYIGNKAVQPNSTIIKRASIGDDD